MRQLALFGSVLHRDDFGPDIDIDVLVVWETVERELIPRLIAQLEQSRNYLRRRAVLQSVETIYAA